MRTGRAAVGHERVTMTDLRSHVAPFLEMLAAERGAAENTLEAYARDLNDFLAQCGRLRHAHTGSDRRRICAVSAKSGLAPATRARKLSAIRHFCRYLVAETVLGEMIRRIR